MNRPVRTEEDLKEASDHLYYEVMMFTSVSNGLSSGVAGQGPITNALLESFVIHMRALMDFLYSNNPKKDDVIAEDFFNDSTAWEDLRPPISEILKKAKKRAGKEVAHLTYARLDVKPEEKHWSISIISKEILDVLNIFINNVTKSKLGKQWVQNA